MDVVFKKRRYYQGKLRNVGDVVKNMGYKHARAFLTVKAAILYVAPPKKKAPPLKLERTVRTTVPVVETEIVDDEVIVDVNEESYVIKDLSYRELQQICREKGLSARGSQVELIERLEVLEA